MKKAIIALSLVGVILLESPMLMLGDQVLAAEKWDNIVQDSGALEKDLL